MKDGVGLINGDGGRDNAKQTETAGDNFRRQKQRKTEMAID